MASNTYTLANGSTWKGSAIPSATTVSWSVAGTPTSLAADGSRSVNKVVVDNKTATITVESYDASVVNHSNYNPGSAGSLVLKTALRSDGSGAGSTLTITFAEAVFIGAEAASPNDGAGGIVLTFQAYDSNDDNSLVAYS